MTGPHAQRLVERARDLLGSGDAGKALEALSGALALAPEVAAAPYARLLAQITPRGWFARLDSDLRVCLAAPDVDPQTLARTAARLLLLKYPEPGIAQAGEDPLWIAFLTRCINVDPAMEARLAWMADRAELGTALREALAVQAFASEYVWGGEALGVPRAALVEMAEERALAEALPDIGGPRDAASAAVRAQYEANPYPRWRAPPAPAPISLREALRARGGQPEAAVAVLVAGCGTGFEPIDLARTDPSITVTALDLSRASLAYGARMARGLGVERIRFAAGDLRDVARLRQSFDLVTSTGVLHHMADPAAGLASLAGVLKPGGLLRIALYSARARQWVAEAHRTIVDHGWEATPEGIRAFRAHILALPPGTSLARLRESDDFYTLSGCRDLCFHAHEHWFRLPAIGAMLAGAGLELLGLDLPPEAARFDADRRDLGAWDAIEAAHPHLFAGMYQLWCRRSAQAA